MTEYTGKHPDAAVLSTASSIRTSGVWFKLGIWNHSTTCDGAFVEDMSVKLKMHSDRCVPNKDNMTKLINNTSTRLIYYLPLGWVRLNNLYHWHRPIGDTLCPLTVSYEPLRKASIELITSAPVDAANRASTDWNIINWVLVYVYNVILTFLTLQNIAIPDLTSIFNAIFAIPPAIRITVGRKDRILVTQLPKYSSS